MTRETLEFGRWQRGPVDALVCLAVFLALLALLLWVYRQDVRRLPRALQSTLMLLRFAVCGLLFFVFLDPQLRTETTIQRPSRVAIAVDRSLSMTITDPVDSTDSDRSNRSVKVLSALRDGPLLPELTAVHEVAVYAFGKSTPVIGRLPLRPHSAADSKDVGNVAIDWSAMSPTDDETRIGDALNDIYRENLSAPLSAVILVTDGQNNAGADLESAIRMAKDTGAPVYPVGVGADRLPVNLHVSDVQVPSRAFKGDQFRGKAFVRGIGMPRKRTSVEILLKPRDLDVPPTRIDTRDIELPEDESVVPIDFTVLPEVSGHWQIIVRVPAEPGETLADDNSAAAGFDVVDQKTKVLLIAGGPTREYRFLRNLLYREPSVDVAVHLQTSRGSAQEADEILLTLPESRDGLFRFDVVVAIDPDWSAIPPATVALIRDWVATQAGGLILIAGPVNTSRVARLENRAALDALYPVVLKEVFTSDFDAGRFVQPWPVRFTPEGELAAYLRLDDDPETSRRRWEQFEGVYWCFPVSSVKPATTVIANFNDPRAQSGGVAPPLFASQFYGAGRVFYAGTGEMWRLRQLGEQYYDRFWIRLVREMSQGRLLRGASRAVLLVEADRFPVGTNLTVRAQVLGNDFQPLIEKNIPISIVDPKGRASNIELAAQVGRPGFYSAGMTLQFPGEYRIQLLVPGTSEIVERRIAAEIPERELADTRLNRPLLERLAVETGGKLLGFDEVRQIPSLLKDRTETTILSGLPRPLWDNVWVLLSIAGLASLEWLIRKLAYLA